ncbi:MAG: RHS repeat-associated core domain-containing protein [Gemmataceae bacterium]
MGHGQAGAVGTEAFDAWADLDADGNLAARRVFGGGVDQPLARVAAGQAGWYLTDARGSVRAVTDGSGAVTGTRDYAPFGAVTATAGAGLDRYAWTGRELDGALGFQYHRARMYDVGAGRWLSEDPAGFAAGDPNLYRYAGNSPTNATDPSGLQPPALAPAPSAESSGDPKVRLLCELFADALRQERQRRALEAATPRMTAVSPTEAAQRDRLREWQRQREETNIRYQGFLERIRTRNLAGLPSINFGLIEQADALYRRDDAAAWARLSPTEQFVMELGKQVVLFLAAGPVGEWAAAGGLTVGRTASGMVRVAQGGRTVEFAEAELATLRSATGGLAPLRSSAGIPSGAASPVGNINRSVTMQELLADSTLVPGMKGAYVDVPVLGGRTKNGILFEDLSQLTINHNGAEFMLTRETVTASNGQIVSARWRIYSGTTDQIPPPAFLRTGPKGETIVERIIGHTHPRPMPFQPRWNQPSGADIQYLQRIRAEWQRIYGPNSEPFGRIFGDIGDPAVIYGPRSTHGAAVPP